MSLLICTLTYLPAQDTPNLKITGRGFIVDKTHKEGPANIVEKVDSNYAFQSDHHSTAQTWVYANAWVGGVEAWIAGTFYVDFEVTGLPQGYSFVAPMVLARIKLSGLVDSFGIGHPDTNYRIQVMTGLTDRTDFNWAQVSLRKTIFSRKDKETWKSADFVTTLATAAAQSLISEIPVVGNALDVVTEVASTARDAIDCEAKISRRGWVRFFNVPLVAGKRYRVFLTVESQVKAAAIAAGQRSIKVDFYGWPPFFTSETKSLKEWGFGIESVTVVFPDSVYSRPAAAASSPKKPSTPPRSDLQFSQKPELIGAEKIMAGNYKIIESSPVALQLSLTTRLQDQENVKVLVQMPELGWKENMLFPAVFKDKSITSSVRLPELKLPSAGSHKTFKIESVIDPLAEIKNETRNNNTETIFLLVTPGYYQLRAKKITLEPAQAEYSENQPIKILGVIKNESNVDLKTVEAGFYYNSGTHDKTR